MVLLLAVCAALASFTLPSPMGGETFEIYVDKKLVLRHFVSVSKEPQSFQLTRENGNAQVDIYYNHCGELGKARHLTLRNAQNKVVKQWNFSGNEKFMSFHAKDLVDAVEGNEKLSLYYSAEQLPKGRFLASVIVL